MLQLLHVVQQDGVHRPRSGAAADIATAATTAIRRGRAGCCDTCRQGFSLGGTGAVPLPCCLPQLRHMRPQLLCHLLGRPAQPPLRRQLCLKRWQPLLLQGPRRQAGAAQLSVQLCQAGFPLLLLILHG